ncbi:hypothetical protein PVK06_043592 [Gossypium arboreum]|uniref:Uncharacterized protein n=1 Tax=Gossypium arboreum TaxID=29729 RepID=A0ABR0MP91_GOSAR|nr:hypothetical protein PVK06_043592 [Gossypium arboreum]
MPSRKVRKTMETEPSMVQTPSNVPNLNIEKYFNELQGKTFIQERGFDPSIILCKVIWPSVDGNIGRSQKIISWFSLYKNSMHLYGTMSLEILKVIYGIQYLCEGKRYK